MDVLATKKIFSPPPKKNSPVRHRHPARPLGPPPGTPPPPSGIFNKKTDSLPPQRFGLPLPLPEPNKNSKHPKRPPRESVSVIDADMMERTQNPVLLGRCPSTVRCVFPVLVFQLGKQQNRAWTTSSTVLNWNPSEPYSDKELLELRYRWPFTGVIWALRPKVRKKSRKGFPGPLGPGDPKSQQTIENQLFFKFFSSF